MEKPSPYSHLKVNTRMMNKSRAMTSHFVIRGAKGLVTRNRIMFLGLFHMLYVYVFMYFIAFYIHFICFAVAIRFHWSFGSPAEKKGKRSQSGAKELIVANMSKWSSLSPLAATSFN